MGRKREYMTIPELAKMLGISRIAVYKKVRSGKIKAERIGRNYAIPRSRTAGAAKKELTGRDKRRIDAAVRKAVREYGETFRLLGRE
jgi:excisionase family DNA binding protein